MEDMDFGQASIDNIATTSSDNSTAISVDTAHQTSIDDTSPEAISGALSWSQVSPFCHVGCIFSKSTDYGDILLRPGGSGIYPPETWRMLASSSVCLANDLCTSGVWSIIFALCTRMAGIDLGLESESVVWIAEAGVFYRLLSAPAWVSHSQRFTMPFNVQAALCFPLASWVNALRICPCFSRGRVFLRGISGYMARKSGSKVVGTLDPEPGSWDPEPESWNPEPRSWDPEPGSWNPEPRGGRAAVFSALRQGFFAEQLQWNSTSTQRRSINLAIRLI
ncbi:hypothetical protein DY000_02052519 [Brassica cretica]|uniref:Uncharacterized protein n=1 Tax=Brassica cretica TaxID=69181 RepID=A0ABQ7AKA6_BRACR|nr:hypothetical protein DY000_02052519 [Brassica cretica]